MNIVTIIIFWTVLLLRMTAKGPYCRAMFSELLPKAPIGNTPHVSDLRKLSCSKIAWSFSPEYKEKIICSRTCRWGAFKICYYSWNKLWIFIGSEIYSERKDHTPRSSGIYFRDTNDSAFAYKSLQYIIFILTKWKIKII